MEHRFTLYFDNIGMQRRGEKSYWSKRRHVKSAIKEHIDFLTTTSILGANTDRSSAESFHIPSYLDSNLPYSTDPASDQGCMTEICQEVCFQEADIVSHGSYDIQLSGR